MTEPLLIQRQRTVLHELVRLAAARAAAEEESKTTFRTRNETAEITLQAELARLAERFQAEKEATEREYEAVRTALADAFKNETKTAKNELSDTRLQITEQYDHDKQEAQATYQEARWTATAVLEADKTKADSELQEAQRKLAADLQRIEALRQESDRRFAAWVGPPDATEPAAKKEPPPLADDPVPRLHERIAAAERILAEGKRLTLLLRLAHGKRFALLVVLLGILAMIPAALTADPYFRLGGIALMALCTGVGGQICLRVLARVRVSRIYPPLCEALADAEMWHRVCQQRVTVRHERQLTRAKKKYDTASASAEEAYQSKMAAITRRRDADGWQNDYRYEHRMAQATRRRDAETQAADEKYPRMLAELQTRFDADTEAARQKHRRELDDSQAAYTTAWQALTRQWEEGLAWAESETTAVATESQRLFPEWTSPTWQNWTPPETFPPVLRFGEFPVERSALPHGIPQDERLVPIGPAGFTFPAFLAFPAQCSLVIRVGEGSRAAAEEAVQLLMFRLLTALPPSKVRFTIIDPVGLGQSFAAFMHLADHDEQLVASRIWTEHQHIDQRLADLTAHMENVIQKYLRNQYETIEEYNVHAGEVAEPFRFLVVANFPVNFTPEAARRLVSIAASGARCGVHTIVTVDPKQPLPQGFHMADLERHAILFDCGQTSEVSKTSEVWRWHEPDFGQFPLRLDPMPDTDFTTRLLQLIGQEAKKASRVEVPFEFIAPSPDRWWTADSRPGIDVAIGRSGATKRQHFALGHGTAQHVLVAGKTGSGKSTLLHALITNLALTYSPEEIELYLVDFKEGVEFKDYATYDLPHARVVAIESEREFGLSVLQRLDAELKDRGERFRKLGVQDLAGYRNAAGVALPRILLIVDEFQLFFVEDDKIAQDASLLLDRLVRQGRAFGIHILLGSQTLGGAYTLARSTLGQMAVRIALECSETDAHLILSDDNTAARLLSRPGEAIYNDANGLVEGNDFFQVVWLPDDKREEYLRCIRAVAEHRKYVRPQPQIVFEGRAPADVGKNHLLHRLLAAPDWPPPSRVAQAWLGEAMAIKDPTAADFRPQGGRNLLIVGQDDEAAVGILATALVSLAAQQAPSAVTGSPDPATGPTEGLPGTPNGDRRSAESAGSGDPRRAHSQQGGARFYLLDGTPVDAPFAGYLQQLTDIVPHPVKLGGWRDGLPFLTELAEEVDRRVKTPDAEAGSVYLMICGLQRFRDLRKADDDFSFSRRTENALPNPGKLFSTILRDGPAVGVYTLVWADTLNNVNRALDRQGLREFDLRILFQVSANDSSTLIDTPLASKLGPYRALLYREDRGTAEKFRPYGLPPRSWLEWVKEQLHLKPNSQRTEDRGQRTEVGGQTSEVATAGD
jgi:energy-coupling factor transporter ATP-binding protein EcfA2